MVTIMVKSHQRKRADTFHASPLMKLNFVYGTVTVNMSDGMPTTSSPIMNHA